MSRGEKRGDVFDTAKERSHLFKKLTQPEVEKVKKQLLQVIILYS